MPERLPGIRPRQSPWRRLDIAARHSFPTACTVVLLLLARAPIGLPSQAQLQPAVALASVFFWSVFRPTALPPAVIFAIGLLLDLIGLGPIGLWVFLLLAVHGVAVRFRRTLARQGFLLVWLAFDATAALAALLSWLGTSLLNWEFLPLGPALFEAVLAASIYPALSTLLTHAHRTIADPGQA